MSSVDRSGAQDSHRLSHLIKEWDRFTAGVERGYGFGLLEYENDLSIRDQIKRVLDGGALLSPDQATVLARADERLKQSLMKTKAPLYPNTHPDDFWYFGLPKQSSAELIDDARDEGLL